MDEAQRVARRWVLVGGASGVVAAASYIALVATSPPSWLLLALITPYCVGLSLSGLGLGVLMRLHRPSVGAWIASRMLVVGGAIMTLMLIVQQTIVGYMGRYIAGAETETERDMLRAVDRGLGTVHLGMDVAWDIFLLAAAIPFSWHLLRHPRFGVLWGGPGLLLSAALVGVELWAFPVSPYEGGAPYLIGPLLAMWFLAVHVRSLMSMGWAGERARERGLSAMAVHP